MSLQSRARVQPQPPLLPLHKTRDSVSRDRSQTHKDHGVPQPPKPRDSDKDTLLTEIDQLWAHPVAESARLSETARRENMRVAQALRALDSASQSQSARATIEACEERSRIHEQQFDSLCNEIDEMLGQHYGMSQPSLPQLQTAPLPSTNLSPKKIVSASPAVPPSTKHFSVRSPANEGMYSVYGGNSTSNLRPSSQTIYDKIQKYRANPDERKQLKERVDRYVEERKEKERRQTKFKNFRELNKYSIFYMNPAIHETEIKARAQERDEHAQRVAESRKDMEVAAFRRKMTKIDLKNANAEPSSKRIPTPPITPRIKSSTHRDTISSSSNHSISTLSSQPNPISRSRSTPASARSHS